MSHSQFHSIEAFILRHAWLSLWDKHMTTGRINQVTVVGPGHQVPQTAQPSHGSEEPTFSLTDNNERTRSLQILYDTTSETAAARASAGPRQLPRSVNTSHKAVDRHTNQRNVHCTWNGATSLGTDATGRTEHIQSTPSTPMRLKPLLTGEPGHATVCETSSTPAENPSDQRPSRAEMPFKTPVPHNVVSDIWG